jgi:hypothetical protein
MQNTETDFFGKQDGERILYVVKPHPLSLSFKIAKMYMVSIIVFLAFTLLGIQLGIHEAFVISGLIVAVLIAAIGSKIVIDYQARDIAYITDRRLVRFEPTTLVATNPRSITWDEVVKVKTYPPNAIWKQLAIGSISVHSRSSMRDDYPDEKKFYDISVDDIELKDVYLYKDLGNYLDKILFIYKQRPKELYTIHEFIPKPKGERY